MASPLGHALAGLTVHLLVSRDHSEWRDWRRGTLIVGASLAADLDFAFRLIDGSNHHGRETHSIGAAFLAAAFAAAVLRLWRHPAWAAVASAVGLAWSSHVALDLLNVDTSPPIGIQALWPLDERHYKAPVLLLLDVGRRLDWTTVRHNAVAGAWECALLGPFLLASWRLRRSRLEVPDGTGVREQGGGGPAGVGGGEALLRSGGGGEPRGAAEGAGARPR